MCGNSTQFIIENIVQDLKLKKTSVENTVDLLKQEATIPFIARYRKEKTGSLDETCIKNISERLRYYTDLEKRKETIRATIKEQGKLTVELENEIILCKEKQKLEDIYLPYKPKKRSRATLAKEKGLEPLADLILSQKAMIGLRKEDIIAPYINSQKSVETAQEALQGASDIAAQEISDSPEIREIVRNYIQKNGTLLSRVRKEWAGKKSKFEMYYDFSGSMTNLPLHRVLAIRRGAKEEVLSWKIKVDDEQAIALIESKVVNIKNFLFHEELLSAIKDSYKRLIFPSLEIEIFLNKLEEAENEAITVFSKNLKNLLLASPAGNKIIMGIDPGFRTGCKLAVIDRNGNFQEYQTVFPHAPQSRKDEAEKDLLYLMRKYAVELIAIGNGTASKETYVFVKGLIEKYNAAAKAIIVSEAGASVYSASDLGKEEFPELDVTVRGAVSIARRLQDPLAELVKIEPKSIGVGQYQHDVNQSELKRSLDTVVESCVNSVGVELNTSSTELLSYVSGIGKSVAENIVKYRLETGSFSNKTELLNVPKLGPTIYEQSAGFLRIISADNPLDNSAIHPESYPIVEKMAKDNGIEIKKLIGNENVISKIKITDYVTDSAGIPTLRDILKELKKPGLDPRKEFSSVKFSSLINGIDDLSIDMVLEGTVTNVTNFGAFVDIGVHNDGLMHISHMSDKYVKNPHTIVSVGDPVRVKIISIDKELKRIGLEMV